MAKKIVIIGAGPGGYVAAIRAAQLGAEVLVIEKETFGGTCLNWGCVPTKTLLSSARVYRDAYRTRDFGVYTRVDSFRFDKMIARKNSIVQTHVRGIAHLFKKHKIQSIKGTGKLLDSNRVEIVTEDGRTLQKAADAIIIATGSEPLVPDFIKLDRDRIITTTEALALEKLPQSIAIVGGSVSGCEFACLFAMLGVKVSLIEMLDTLVPTEEPEISQQLAASLNALGVDVLIGTALKSLERVYPSGAVKVATEKQQILADYCLLTMGRRLNTDDIGLGQAGISFSHQGVEVNEKMETSVAGVYAIGDVVGKALLAHVASQQGIVAAENIIGRQTLMDYAAVPGFIYTDPEIASVGLKEVEAKERGLDILVGRATFKTNAMAYALGETDGFIKAIVKKSDLRVLGIHIIGPHATDLLGEAVTMVTSGMSIEDVKKVIHPHPTICETMKEAILDSVNEAIHA